MIIFNMLFQFVLAYVVPFLIIESFYNKKGKIYSIIIIPFFLLNWILQAMFFIPGLYSIEPSLQYANILFGEDIDATISSILLWINDVCVFLFPILCDISSRKLAKGEKNENDEQNIETEDTINLDDMNNKKIQPQFCRVCGYDIKENSNYCRKCGQKIWDGESNDL